jgi:hypothetical protein
MVSSDDGSNALGAPLVLQMRGYGFAIDRSVPEQSRENAAAVVAGRDHAARS